MIYLSHELDGIFDMDYNEVVELHKEHKIYNYEKAIIEIQDLCKNDGYVYLVAACNDSGPDSILGVFPNESDAMKYRDMQRKEFPRDDIYMSEAWNIYYSKKHYYDCKKTRTYIPEFDLSFEDYNFKEVEYCDNCDMYNFSQDEADETEYTNILKRDYKKGIYTLELVFLPRRKSFVLRGRNENDMSTYVEMETTHCPFCGRNLKERIKKALE